MDTHINDMLTKTQQVSIMDLGKQLLEAASNGQSNKVHELMCRGAPFTTDWVNIYFLRFCSILLYCMIIGNKSFLSS